MKHASAKTSHTASRTRSDRLLLRDIGSLADRVLRSCGPAAPAPGKPLLERALAAAATVEQRMAEQQARIAYLETLTQTDELTGLLNRRGFNEQLRRTLATARRYGDTGVLLFCDVDGLKTINDTHGHAAGDKALKAVARLLKDSVREIDVVARLGGDEFGVILTQTNWRNGYKRAQAIVRLFERQTFVVGRKSMRIGVSLGVEPFGPDDEADNLIARADMAMYCQKRKKASIAFVTAAE